jgi:TolA-binding protein
MTRDPDFSDDLLARARRAPLSEGEARRLRELLASSVESRLLYEAGCAFDREAPVQAGDDARLEQMLRQVEERADPTPRRQPQRLGRALATGLLLGTAAVAAVELGQAVFMPGHTGDVRTAAAPSVAPPARVAPPGVAVPSDLAQATAPSALAVVVSAPSARVVLPATGRPVAQADSAALAPVSTPLPAQVESREGAPSPAVGEGERPTAPQLFSLANRARVAGEVDSAISTYRRLELEYPHSSEAVTARLSLGMLYLQNGAPERALEQFNAYRAVAHGPALAEALFGEARALERLGRREDERERLRELLEKFPRSAYAAAARRRLDEL